MYGTHFKGTFSSFLVLITNKKVAKTETSFLVLDKYLHNALFYDS